MMRMRAEGGPGDGPEPHPLDAIRGRIEAVDDEILRLLAERVRLAREAGRLKRAAGLPVFDPAREAAVVRRGAALARELGFADEEARLILWQVIGLCRRGQAEEAAAEGPA